MQISKRALVIESSLAATAVLAISAALWPAGYGLFDSEFHPAWIAIIALAARYGPLGLFVSLPAIWTPLAGVSFLEAGGEWVILERAAARSDLFPLITSVTVAWVTISHQSRLSRASELLAEAERDLDATREWAKALSDSLAYLRGRCDRIEVSVNFWRRLGECLERGELGQAADAALELCMIRTGATAGCVELSNGSAVVRRGVWAMADLSGDLTVQAAIADRDIRVARDLSGAGQSDCDVAVPVRDNLGDESVLGVIALRGVEPAQLKPAELSDLALISDWLSPAIARQVRGPRLRPVTEDFYA